MNTYRVIIDYTKGHRVEVSNERGKKELHIGWEELEKFIAYSSVLYANRKLYPDVKEIRLHQYVENMIHTPLL